MDKLQCRICGGKLVMNENDIAVCTYCGMEYKPETLQKMMVELSGPIEVQGINSKQRLFEKAETLERIGEIDHAFETYTQIAEEYPEECQGWWGLIVCKTQYFDKIIPDQSELNKWFGYVKQLASENEYAEYEKIYLEYIKKVAELPALEDMKAINNKISSYNREISACNDRIKLIETKINDRQSAIITEDESFQTTNEYIDKTAADIQIKIETAQKEKIKDTKWNTIFGVMVAIGVVMTCTGGWRTILGLLIAAAGIAAFPFGAEAHKNDSGLITKLFAILAEKKSAKAANEQDHDKKIIEYNNQIEHLKDEITECQETITGILEKIAECESYLALGKDKIATYWYAKKCRDIGIGQPVESYIIERRNVAFEIHENAAEEMITIACPTCGKQITAIEDEIIKTGSMICKTCGNTIEITAGEDNASSGAA